RSVVPPLGSRIDDDGVDGTLNRATPCVQMRGTNDTVRINIGVIGEIVGGDMVVTRTIPPAQHQFTLLDVVVQIHLRVVLVLAVVARNVAVFLPPRIFGDDAVLGDLRFHRRPIRVLRIATQPITGVTAVIIHAEAVVAVEHQLVGVNIGFRGGKQDVTPFAYLRRVTVHQKNVGAIPEIIGDVGNGVGGGCP